MIIPITKVNFDKKEEDAVLKVMRSGNLVMGENVGKFEKKFADYIGCKYAVAVSSGTTALYLSLLALNIGRGDEVITTPFSFIASTNAVLYVRAKPVFADIGYDFNINADKIEEKITSKTKAILIVHLFGNPCDMDKIQKIAKKYKLKVIEDACQAHGAEFMGKKVGSFGDISCFSFYATKNMAIGEGGIITTNSKKIHNKLVLLRSHGSKKKYYHKFLGYNFRLTEIQAAIGIEQLKKLDKLNKVRIQNAKYLSTLFGKIKEITVPEIRKNKKHIFHQFSILLSSNIKLSRNNLIKILDKKGIGYGIYYPIPIHKQEQFKNSGYKEKLPISEKVSKRILSIPIHPGLKKKDLDYIYHVIKMQYE